MRVCVCLGGGLRELAGLGSGQIVLDDPALRKVGDIMTRLPLKRGDVGLVLSAGRLLNADDALADGMVVVLYPMVGGG